MVLQEGLLITGNSSTDSTLPQLLNSQFKIWIIVNKSNSRSDRDVTNTRHNSTSKKKWEDMINQSVHTADDIDIGEIDAISRDFVVVKRGYINEHYYYIPITKVEGWDGNVVWLKTKEDEVKVKYERQIVPDPSRYYIKGYSDYSTPFPDLKTITPKYEKPSREAAIIPPDDPNRQYGCALCKELFKTQDELSNHVSTNH